MVKKALCAVVVGLSAAALAVILIQGARGRGIAVNAAGVRGHFLIDVAKSTHGELTRIEGGMVWESRIPSDGRAIRIEMRQAREFVKDGNVAHFAGPARAAVLSPAGQRVIEGVMHAVVRDLRNPEHPSTQRDQIALDFRALGTVFRYTFEGVVVEGDIRVYERIIE